MYLKNKDKQFNFRINSDDLCELKKRAQALGVSPSYLVNSLVKNYLKAVKNNEYK